MGKDALDTKEMIESADEFESAYRSHAPSIYRFLLWRTNDTTLSEDLTSNVFEKAWRARGSFHGGSVRSWLYRIAHNVLIDHWRKKHDVPVEDMDTMTVADTPSLDEAMDARLELDRLQIALNQLPDSMREIVKLRFIEGLSGRQVAERLDLSEANVRVLQYRALKKLKDLLQ